MRILVVSQYYRPENSKIPTGLAEQLAAKGHSVRVITGFPNYPYGKVFEGFKQRLRFVQVVNGVTIRRVPLFISHSQNPFGRIANYLSFGISSLCAFSFVRDADVVYVYATQMTAAIGPRWWRRLLGLPYILHIQDLWPESVTSSSLVRGKFPQRVIRHLLGGWLRGMYRHASGIVAIAPGMKEMLVERGAASSSTNVVLNWADERVLSVRAPQRSSVGLTVTYAGAIGHFQNLDIALRAAAMVQDLPGFRLIIVGSGVAEGDLRVHAGSIANVEFRGRVPIEEMDAVYDESDFQLISLKNIPIFSGTIPSKLQGSFAAGVPVIAAVAGDTSNIVDEARAGLTSIAGDAGALADAFRDAYSLSSAEVEVMGSNARAFYEQKMSMQSGVEEIEKILAKAALRHRVEKFNLFHKRRVSDRT